MALRAKVRGESRTISKAMARRFRARGLEVRDTEADEHDDLITSPVKVIAPPVEPELPYMMSPAAVLATMIKPPPAAEAFDLSDEDLERLTAPDVGG
jgi:hypothetical protein